MVGICNLAIASEDAGSIDCDHGCNDWRISTVSSCCLDHAADQELFLAYLHSHISTLISASTSHGAVDPLAHLTWIGMLHMNQARPAEDVSGRAQDRLGSIAHGQEPLAPLSFQP